MDIKSAFTLIVGGLTILAVGYGWAVALVRF